MASTGKFSEEKKYDLIVVGGGAAGFFTAIRVGELRPGSRILILEKGGKVLQKVRISGGGRCNVTHACFEPKELVKNYPRGSRELLGPFHRFQPGDTIVAINDKPVHDMLDIQMDTALAPEGAVLTYAVQRPGVDQLLKFDVTRKESLSGSAKVTIFASSAGARLNRR